MNKIILETLCNKGMTLKQISAEVSLGPTTIRYWIKKYGLSLKRGARGKLPKDMLVPRKCGLCGEENPINFYGNKRTVCGKCHSKYTLKRGQIQMEKARAYLGDKCVICGYDRYKTSLDIHHLDPSTKDSSFRNKRGWAWVKVEEELKKCVLLCRCCHGALHSNEMSIEDINKLIPKLG